MGWLMWTAVGGAIWFSVGLILAVVLGRILRRRG